MASEPKRICTGCNQIVLGPCPRCSKTATRQDNQRRRSTPEGKADKAFYDSPAWRRLRAYKLSINPCCEECERQGSDAVAARHVDHVVSRREAPEREYDIGNLRSLCVPCHSRKTATEDGGFGNGRIDVSRQ